jgi:hypothetical protein
MMDSIDWSIASPVRAVHPAGQTDKLHPLAAFHLQLLLRSHPPTPYFRIWQQHNQSFPVATALAASAWLAVSIDLCSNCAETGKLLALD